MDDRQLKKAFPKFFENISIPLSAREQSIQVFRACKTRKIEEASFLPTFVENGYKPIVGISEDDPRQYSLSTDAKKKSLKRFVAIDAKYQPPFLLAVGHTSPDFGVCCFTREYLNSTKQLRKSTHVDYWLYEGATPWIHFEETRYEE